TGRIEGYRNFCNKLWNAARYVLMNTEGKDCGQTGGEIELSLADRWILSRFAKTVAAVNDAITGYRFDHAAQAIYDFTWNEYCDWYLELSKPVLTSGDASEAQQRGTRRTLVQVLEALLRLAHPIMPYITEEIWQRVAPLAGVKGDAQGGASVAGGRTPGATNTIMRQHYPQAGELSVDASAEGEMQWVMDFIVGIRKIRSGMNIPPSKALPVLLQNGSSDDQARLQRNELFLQRLARTASITWLAAGTTAPESAIALVGEMRLLVPMAGLIDKEAELARLTKEIGKLEIEIEKLAGRLGNDNFVAKAPAELVEKEKGRLADMRNALTQLTEQQAKIERL
ncbi:MAG TPA: class I tRNA ligase family protein, partial [Gammaproteobacteria bacterium]